MEDSIPRTAAGQLVSIADKLDTLRGCFRVGLIPSGSKDPFALRRAAQGIVKILVEGKLRLPIRSLLRRRCGAGRILRSTAFATTSAKFAASQYDEVNAVLAAGWTILSISKSALKPFAKSAPPRTSNRSPQLQAHPQYPSAGRSSGELVAGSSSRRCSNAGPKPNSTRRLSKQRASRP